MSNINLKQQLAVLLQLQAIDLQIYTLTEEKESKPLEIQELEKAFAEKKQRFADIEKKSLDLQKAKKDVELELASKEESVKKLQTQLYQLKTNKEYNAMLAQIQDTKADASLVEDKILEVMDKIEAAKAELEEERKRLAEEEKVFQAEKKKIEDRIKQIDERLAQLGANRKQVLPDIDQKILAQYERILQNRSGLAIVSVANNSCSGCNMFVPAQEINQIQMYERIVTCEVCNRILFIPNE